MPLYRVDIGGTKNKYVGQSEGNMLTNLSRLDHEEPCVALLDEVEKVFATSNNDSSGTTSTMLSQLLWWLAERRTRVLVIMTTNKASALPKELYREGRIDKVMVFNGLNHDEAVPFVKSVFGTFKGLKFDLEEAAKTIARRRLRDELEQAAGDRLAGGIDEGRLLVREDAEMQLIAENSIDRRRSPVTM